MRVVDQVEVLVYFGVRVLGKHFLGELVLNLTLQRSLASIGAVITILSLAIDPFVQQIVGVGERQVVLSNSTTIARALRYSRGAILIQVEQLEGIQALFSQL